MKLDISTLSALMGVLSAAVLAGCGGGGVPEPKQGGDALLQQPAIGDDYTPTATWPKSDKEGVARYIRLHIGADVAKTCGLMRAHFEFDSDQPLPQDRSEVKAVADCLNQPGLNTLTVELVGRADSRGNAGYNLDLGKRRAERMKLLLVAEGVAENRIIATSRGDADAVGDAAAASGYSEGFDRRVDVEVKGVTHAPR